MKQDYPTTLLTNWEDIFRQGLLTFWVLIALKKQNLTVVELKSKVKELTNGTYDPAEQTLYRLLRRQYELEILDFKEIAGNAGPSKKLYGLSPIGKQLLADFINRNITLFNHPEITQQIKKGQ